MEAANTAVTSTEELKDRVAQLRVHYEPYLRSLPEPLAARTQRDLSGTWRWKFEVEDFTGGPRPSPPDWHRPDLDDSDWEPTTVPEWRYDRSAPFGTFPDPREHRPDSRIAWYRTSFTSRLAASNRRAFLVFGGATWEAEVWLNGTYLGSHKAYWEPFRFDATSVLKEKNVLAVRILAGPKLGEPTSGWTALSCALAVEPRHERDASRSVVGQRELFGFKASCFGSGFGIHREVLLETTGTSCVANVFARADLHARVATLRVETDSSVDTTLTVDVEILPENFEGRSYHGGVTQRVQRGIGSHSLSVPMPGARLWQQEDPCLYRCRVTLRDGDRTVDAQDVLFGYRSFRIVTDREQRPDRPAGMFLLNDQPVFLRGTAVSPALNTFWYWRQEDRLLNVVLMMKAANFNAIRACEHIECAEVRELQDRLGMMSEQDMVGFGDGKVPTADGGAGNASVSVAVMAELCVNLARACYNNPGVVLLTTGGIETGFDPLAIVTAVLAGDPGRIIKPISGNMRDWPSAYDCPPPDYPSLRKEQWDNVVNDFHCYNGWYRRALEFSKLCQRYPPDRLLTLGEYGAEALDAYETMQRYPPPLRPPPITANALWGYSQVKKGDPRLILGLRGRTPATLGEYIEASQTYQADAMAEQTTGVRLSPRRIAGQFIFHFIDGLPAEWQKSIVSFDSCPKKVFFEMAQVNQPVVPLFQVGDEARMLHLWVANDRDLAWPDSRLGWQIEARGKVLLKGSEAVDVQALDATPVATIDLSSLPTDAATVTVSLALNDAEGKRLSQYRREVYLKAWRPPRYEVRPPASARVPKLPPLADGDPAKVEWSKAALVTGWRKVEGAPARQAIEARVAHDGRHLYIRLAQTGIEGELHSEEGIWTGEDWEIFFAGQQKAPYRQLGVNPKGVILEVVSDPALPLCGPKVVSAVADDGWAVLMSFPLATLVPGGLKSGGVFYGNLYRQTGCIDTYREVLAWSPNYKGECHMPERFGEFTLE